MGISADSREDDAEMSEDLDIGFPLLSDPQRQVIGAYGVADAGPELAMPAVFIVGTNRVIVWRAVGQSMRDLPPVEAIIEALPTPQSNSAP